MIRALRVLVGIMLAHRRRQWPHRRRRLTGIEPAMGYDAGPTLNRHLVGRPTSSVRGTSYASIE